MPDIFCMIMQPMMPVSYTHLDVYKRQTCTCPDAPCRFPDQAFSSMEAYGMLVMQVCQANHLDYYYGPGKIAYTSCYLLK